MDDDHVKVSPVMSPQADIDLPEPASPTEGFKPLPVAAPVDEATAKAVDEVLYSDVGILYYLHHTSILTNNDRLA